MADKPASIDDGWRTALDRLARILDEPGGRQ
jgi:hypothetical protein